MLLALAGPLLGAALGRRKLPHPRCHLVPIGSF